MNYDLFSPPLGSNPSCFMECHFIYNVKIPEESAPFFRKRFVLDAPAKRAVVHLCGIGYHELYINNKKAGDYLLTPPQTFYDKTVFYLSYDITNLLVPGENVMIILSGNGLYNCFGGNVWNYDTAVWRDRPKCMLYGCIETETGAVLTIKSGRDFETGQSQIVHNGFFRGESLDVTLPSFEEAPVQPSKIASSPGGILKPYEGPFVEESEPLSPVRITELSNGKRIYDFGQNRAGWVHISATAAEHTKIVLRYGEVLAENGELDNTEIGAYIDERFQTDEYILDENHSIADARPHFSYYGFRYVEVSIPEGHAETLSLTSYAVHSKVEKIGHFDSSNEIVNKLFQMADASMTSNLVNVITDCPQREKAGWTGDSAFTAENMLFFYDLKKLYANWLCSIRDSQRPSGQIPTIIPSNGFGYNGYSGPAWDISLYELPYDIYRYQKDLQLIRENYDAWKKHMSYMETMADGYIITYGLGDWLPPVEAWSDSCPVPVTSTAFFYYTSTIMEKAASLLELPEDQAYYRSLSVHIREAFQKEFYNPDTKEVEGGYQTTQGVAIYFGLLEKEEEAEAAARLAEMIRENDGKLYFGCLGAKAVPIALAKHNYCQLACDMLLYDGYPSCRHWIDMGCTAMPERWDGKHSNNHHIFTLICTFFIKYVAGLQIPDFQSRKITFTPDFPKQFDWIEAQTENSDGTFYCKWERKDDMIQFYYRIPGGYTEILNVQPGYTVSKVEEGIYYIRKK